MEEARVRGWVTRPGIPNFAERIGKDREEGRRAFDAWFKWLDRYNRRLRRKPLTRATRYARIHCGRSWTCNGEPSCKFADSHRIHESGLDLIPDHAVFGPKTRAMLASVRRSIAARKAWRRRKSRRRKMAKVRQRAA